MYASWCYHGTRFGPKIEPIQLIPLLLAIDGHGFLNDTYIMKQNIVENVHTIKSMSRKIVETKWNKWFYNTHASTKQISSLWPASCARLSQEHVPFRKNRNTWLTQEAWMISYDMKTSPLFATWSRSTARSGLSHERSTSWYAHSCNCNGQWWAVFLPQHTKLT